MADRNQAQIAGGGGSDRFGGYCHVSVSIHPADSAAPNIQVAVDLPVIWNGNSLMFGGGGYNGSIPKTVACLSARQTNKHRWDVDMRHTAATQGTIRPMRPTLR